MNRPKHLLSCLLILISFGGFLPKKICLCFRPGRLMKTKIPFQNVSVVILGRQTGIATNDTGYFRLKVPAEKAFAITFSHAGHLSEQKNFLLHENEEEYISIRLERDETVLKEVVVTDQRDRTEAGLVRPNPKTVINMPAPVTGVESLIKIIVGSNNEFTSQYSVRGGSYDENLIYVNDFEIFRPYLVRNGQQEGLSFINPEMVRNINFYNGGFPAKYGDKMSSVLDIQYKQAQTFWRFRLSWNPGAGPAGGRIVCTIKDSAI